MKYIASAFSIGMVAEGATINFAPITGAELKQSLISYVRDDNGEFYPVIDTLVSCIGHEGTAKAVSKLLHYHVGVERISVSLKAGDTLFVCQPVGQRLAVGAELEMPKLQFYQITVYPRGEVGRLSNLLHEKAIEEGEVEEDRQASQGEQSCQACAFASLFGSAGEIPHTCGKER